MTFYERYYPSCYEELITYYPRFYRDVLEMNAVLKAHGKVADGLESEIEKTYLNGFIKTADDKTLKMWETLLGIVYETKPELEQRRNVIIGLISNRGRIGEQEIRQAISHYTGGKTKIDFSRGVITVNIDGEFFGETNLLDTLKRRIPAHLKLEMTVMVQRSFKRRIDICFIGSTGDFFDIIVNVK